METQNVNDQTQIRKKNISLRIAISTLMLLGGALVFSLTEGNKSTLSLVVQQFGIAAMVAGAVSLLNDMLLEKYRTSSTCPALPLVKDSGIKMTLNQRQGSEHYYRWVINPRPQDLYFAGRSVLHHIQEDLNTHGHEPLENVYLQKLELGCRIKILFCNPTWSIIPELAEQENQSSKAFYTHLAMTMGIVNRLWGKIQSKKLKGSIDIVLYKEFIQFAYHRTSYVNSQDVIMYIGLYFARRVGYRTPLFQVDDIEIQKEFEDHFDSILKNGEIILSYPANGQGRNFNNDLLVECKKHLVEKLGQAECDKYIG